MHRTAQFLLIQVRLGRDLAAYIHDRYPADSWRTIAADVTAATGIPVSHETLREWFPEFGRERGRKVDAA